MISSWGRWGAGGKRQGGKPKICANSNCTHKKIRKGERVDHVGNEYYHHGCYRNHYSEGLRNANAAMDVILSSSVTTRTRYSDSDTSNTASSAMDISESESKEADTPVPVYSLRTRARSAAVPIDSWKSHEWQIFIPTLITEAISQKAVALADATAATKWWTGIRGEMCQAEMSVPLTAAQYESDRLLLVHMITDVAKDQLRQLGYDTTNIYIPTLKLLVAAPGVGLQPFHYDVDDFTRAKNTIGGFIYCTRNKHTAVPRLTAIQMAPAFIEKERLSEFDRLAIAARADPDNFVCDEVAPGTCLVMRLSTLHRAPMNEYETDRIVIYWLASESDEKYQDENARFPLGVDEQDPQHLYSQNPNYRTLTAVRKEQMKLVGLATQGKSHSSSVNALTIALVVAKEEGGASRDAAIKDTAAIEHSSPRTVRSVVNSFIKTGEIPTPDSKKRGRGNPNHPLHNPTEPSFEVELYIHKTLTSIQSTDSYVSLTTLLATLKEKFKIDICRKTLWKWLHELGYVYGAKNWIGGIAPQHRNVRICIFILQYATALRDQSAGIAIIVYTDESYIHDGHTTTKMWYAPASPNKNNVNGENNTGKRIIIIHCLTKDGLLEEVGAYSSNVLSEEYHTCEFVFAEAAAAGEETADYHKTMDGEKWVEYLRNRILPTFAAVYPGKKMYLVLDNASYHHHHGPEWIYPYKFKKAQLAEVLRQRKIHDIAGENGIRIPSDKFSANKSAGGASRKQLEAAVRQLLIDHPDINTTVPQQLMADKKHSLVYTPPFVPEVQPIERVWNIMKADVARQHTVGRNTEETRHQAEGALEKIEADDATKAINHCHEWMNAFLQTDEAGDLQQFGSLQNIIDHPAAAAAILNSLCNRSTSADVN